MGRKGPLEEAERVNHSPTSAEWPESSETRPLLNVHEQPATRSDTGMSAAATDCGDDSRCTSPRTDAKMQMQQHRSMSCGNIAAVSGLAAPDGPPPALLRGAAAAPGICDEAKTNCAVAPRTSGGYWKGRRNRSVSCDDLRHNLTALREDEEMQEFIPRQKSLEGERPPHVLLRSLLREKASAAAAVASRAAAKASVMSAAIAARAAAKASVVSRLQPLLEPRLSENSISWDEALPILDKLNVDLLTTALRTGNLLPVLAKLRAAAYQKPKLGLGQVVGSECMESIIRQQGMQHSAAPNQEMSAAPKQDSETNEKLAQRPMQHSAAPNRERSAAPKQDSETNKKLAQRPMPCPDEHQRGAAKASVIASLKPILQPHLGEYDISWDDAAPVLDRLTIGLLSTALADANLQPVLAKLRAAAYLSPPLKKLGSSDDVRKKLTATSCSLETAGPPAVAV